jgi:hypothetical protein
MNHPSREELTLHVLGEASGDMRQRLAEHLRACPECAAEARRWHATLHRLDSWRLRPPRAPRAWPVPQLRWAAATAALVLLGFALGLAFAPARSAARDQAALTATLRQEMRQSLQQLAAQVDTGRAADLRAIQDLLVRLEQRRAADYAALRKDLETVATLADDQLRAARDQLTLLTYQTLGDTDHPQP